VRRNGEGKEGEGVAGVERRAKRDRILIAGCSEADKIADAGNEQH
jgi:hypothetical protein